MEQLCARLGARALATQELRLQLELEDGCSPEESATGDVGTDAPVPPGRAQARYDKDARSFHRTLRLPVPLLDSKIFLKLLQLDLHANPPGAPIVKIHLAAEPVRPRAAQSGLFLPPSPEPEKLELTLAKIAGIVGQNKVGSLQLLDTHRPEGFLMRHFAPALQQPKRGKQIPRRLKPARNDQGPGSTALQPDPDTKFRTPKKEEDVAVTALRIFRPPVRATVTLREGRPAGIACPGRKEIGGEILWAAGPWRSSGDWWEQEGWARDEWDIAVQEANGIALYRLVRDFLSRQWLLEGSYD